LMSARRRDTARVMTAFSAAVMWHLVLAVTGASPRPSGAARRLACPAPLVASPALGLPCRRALPRPWRTPCISSVTLSSTREAKPKKSGSE
jgi:hypothetical protein